MSDELGYFGKVGELLNRLSIKIGDKVLVERIDGLKIEGIVLPRGEIGLDDKYLLIKLKNGYNMGIHVDVYPIIIKN
ncbi:MAG: hypothetical protein ACTSSP_06520 [Candidatus Asgardarchaeia archaeon]